jgi:hypothetical protein
VPAAALRIADDNEETTTADAAALATTDARYAATAALAALSAAASSAAALTPPPPVRDFIDDLAGMLPVRLTVHQREVLEASLTRAVDAIIVQCAS